MSTIYAILLGAVFIAFIAATMEAVLSVSTKETWSLPTTQLALVETTERRTQDLRFVGTDRRVALNEDAAPQAERLAA